MIDAFTMNRLATARNVQGVSACGCRRRWLVDDAARLVPDSTWPQAGGGRPGRPGRGRAARAARGVDARPPRRRSESAAFLGRGPRPQRVWPGEFYDSGLNFPGREIDPGEIRIYAGLGGGG